MKKTMNLEVKLNKDEIEQRRATAFKLLDQIDRIEEDRVAHNASLKAEIKTLDTTVHKLRNEARSGRAMRDVEVVDRPDYQAGKMDVVRTDTEAVEYSRMLTEDEMQTQLDLEGKKPAAKKKRTPRKRTTTKRTPKPGVET